MRAPWPRAMRVGCEQAEALARAKPQLGFSGLSNLHLWAIPHSTFALGGRNRSSGSHTVVRICSDVSLTKAVGRVAVSIEEP